MSLVIVEGGEETVVEATGATSLVIGERGPRRVGYYSEEASLPSAGSQQYQ